MKNIVEMLFSIMCLCFAGVILIFLGIFNGDDGGSGITLGLTIIALISTIIGLVKGIGAYIHSRKE